jgi:uncharacterized protein (TIGR03118 family)
LEDRSLLSANVVQSNLISDIAGFAATRDTRLVNPWGIAASPTSPFWVSDSGTGVTTLFSGHGQIVRQTVNMPTNPVGSFLPQGSPTGIVFNTANAGFNISRNGRTGSSTIIFDTLDGTISGWSPGVDLTHAVVQVASPGSEFTGLAMGVDSHQNTLLYAADFSKAKIDVFDSTFQQVTLLSGSFSDKKLPKNYAPFNIQNINGELYVEYGKMAPVTRSLDSGLGNGFVDVYSTDGKLLKRLIKKGLLDSPWGVALAPSNFGKFSNDLLVGNFGNGRINAYDPKSGHFLGALATKSGRPFVEDHLRALQFGNGTTAGLKNTLFFTAGIDKEIHGLFGSLKAIPTVTLKDSLLYQLVSVPKHTFSPASTHGDFIPDGVAFVPNGFQGGRFLQAGDILDSNYNNSTNNLGPASTVVRITPNGQHSVFFQGGPGLGLTSALGVLRSGFVIVGNIPTEADGTGQQGSLLILNGKGKVMLTLSDPALLNGPWGLAINDRGKAAQIFVSNVLSGTVTRINLDLPKGGKPIVASETRIAAGFNHWQDTKSKSIGPSGLAYDPRHDILYVASTGDNEVFAIPHASSDLRSHGKGSIVFKDAKHLHGPLGLALLPNGHLVTANGDAVNPVANNPNELVEFTPKGHFVGQFQVDSGAAGGASGVAVSSVNGVVRFAAVDINTHTLEVWKL